MVGQSATMMELREQILAVAPSKTTVLIRGQTGAGKELVARALHENSPRAEATFAAVNCSALAAGVLESELFGHVRGAFTGAHRARKGLFEVADGGTLFLDEVGDMPAGLQPKLLRVIEEGLVTPVGSSQPRAVDVRLVAATHRDLEAGVAEGTFRQDLLFRLNVFQLQVPALTQRTADVLPLARHFLAIFAAEHAKQAPEFTPEAAAALQAYTWPGNVRELKNEMERAVLLTPAGENLGVGHLSERVRGGVDAPSVDMEGNLKDILERLEAMVLRCALQRHQGNRTHCAKALGISRQALIAKIQRLGVEEDG
jgi:DNA-binding NtrC family response regulator